MVRSFRHAAAELSLTTARPALAPLGDPPAMAAANQVTGYDPESLRVVSIDTAQTETTEEEYLQDMIRVWRGRKNRAAASRNACAGAAQQQTTLPFRGHPKLFGEFSRGVVTVSQDETSESVKRKLSAEPNVVSVRKLGRTPVVVLTFAGTKVPRTVLCSYERLPVHLHKNTVPACPFCGTVGHRADACPQPQARRCGCWGSRSLMPVLTVPRTPVCSKLSPLRRQPPNRSSQLGLELRLFFRVRIPGEDPGGEPGLIGFRNHPAHPGAPALRSSRLCRVPTPKGGPKKPEPKKARTGSPTNVKSGIQARPPVLKAKDFPPLAPVEPKVSSWRGAVSRPSPTETAVQQQVEKLRRQNQIIARKIHELEAKQAGPSETIQEAEIEDGDDVSSVKSCLTSVSRRTEDTVVGSVSTAGHIGRLEALERTTEQLEERVAALPNQTMSAVRESFLDMFTAALTQTLPEIVAKVSDPVLNAMQPWVSTQIKCAARCDSPLLKRKTASRQAAEESGSGPALGGPVQPLTSTAPPPGPSRSPTT
ncbi:hypothetical protein HPB49_026053 [Dermacentor silvarum]|nr:hypothetical protein HPB49_026053 [Dermacentor silvarum]